MNYVLRFKKLSLTRKRSGDYSSEDEGSKHNHQHHQENQKLGSAEGILKLIGSRNRHKYIVATQDEQLKEKLRRIPGVPIIYANKTSLMLETPSSASQLKWEKQEKSKGTRRIKDDVEIAAKEMNLDKEEIMKLKKESYAKLPIMREKRKARGPNPLSVKKKKSKTKHGNDAEGNQDTGDSQQDSNLE